ncbi:conserved hypothetical protein [Theileria equi strain WA]|uniref:Uncharacterized protein n=1 Tax=Theileria equi strain WA TaxID=1537102 RepID=L1LG56_THEEQ|nr:conserved hypothetical protein [Theileria equi strain WA]EKX74331.1 conserved hypothetical protein [Theileria equi strain WA]|eukprot:XP_004833783.1 conserved hypothetical protein [Theileria equi strain WA]
MSDLRYIGHFSLDFFNNKVIQATIDKCAEKFDSRILDAIKQSWIENLNKRLNAVKTETDAKIPRTSSFIQDSFESKSENVHDRESSSDDEFLDADVESVTVSDLKSLPQDTHVETPIAKSERTEAIFASETKEDSNKEVESDPKSTRDDKNVDDSDVSFSDVSDLEDQEPESQDMIIGILDKITRPSSKKFGPPLWKLKLKHGIMQINDVEIPFDSLQGEFEF